MRHDSKHMHRCSAATLTCTVLHHTRIRTANSPCCHHPFFDTNDMYALLPEHTLSSLDGSHRQTPMQHRPMVGSSCPDMHVLQRAPCSLDSSHRHCPEVFEHRLATPSPSFTRPDLTCIFFSMPHALLVAVRMQGNTHATPIQNSDSTPSVRVQCKESPSIAYQDIRYVALHTNSLSTAR
jgi:hypothetical protein